MIPHLTRSNLHRGLKRHGISRLPRVEEEAQTKPRFKTYEIGYFPIEICEVRCAEGTFQLFVAIDRTSKFAYAELHTSARRCQLVACQPDWRAERVMTASVITFMPQ